MRRSQPTRQTWSPFPFLGDEGVGANRKTKQKPRSPAARFTLRADEVGELKLQGCARGTPASFLAAREPTAYGVTA